MTHVFADRIAVQGGLECLRPQRRKERAGSVHAVPPFPFFGVGGQRGGCACDWDDGTVRPVALAALGQRYRRYRLADPPAEEAMAGSLRRWGQLSPVVACVREERLELLDGFKRLAAALQVGWTTLSVRVLERGRATGEGGDPGA